MKIQRIKMLMKSINKAKLEIEFATLKNLKTIYTTTKISESSNRKSFANFYYFVYNLKIMILNKCLIPRNI